jgi:GAF domain-containing protein
VIPQSRKARSPRDPKARRDSTLEQAALRRIAMLTAQGADPRELFAAVAEEVGHVVGAPAVAVARYGSDDTAAVCGTFPVQGPLFRTGARVSLGSGSVLGLIRGNAKPARVDNYTKLEGEIAEAVRSSGLRSSVGVPIMVAGRVWGAIVVANTERLPEDTGARLAEITELLAASIADTEARETLAQLAEEQAALRRVATLVARGVAPTEVFAAVSSEVDRLLKLSPDGDDVAGVVRFDPRPEHVVVGVSRTLDTVTLGSRWPPIDLYAPTRVLQTARSARVGADDLAAADGPQAAFLRESGYLTQVASPIVVNGRLWGAVSANSAETLPPDTEERLEKFIDLVATAIANAEAREALGALADEQAALRRVATLIAQGVRPIEVFWAVSDEIACLLGTQLAAVGRFEPDGRTIDLVGAAKTHERWELADFLASAEVLRTGRSARVDAAGPEWAEGETAERIRSLGIVSTVASPIVVEGNLWGAMLVASTDAPLPPDTEARLESFTELVATAIANTDVREQMQALTDEQAALRRVATLVARDAPPADVFNAVAMEVGKLLDTDITVVGRYDGDAAATATGSWSSSPGEVPVGTRSALGGHNVLTLVAETERSARVDGYDDASGEAAEIARRYGWKSSIAAPIIVEGRLWGVMLVATKRPELFPAGTEDRLAAFTDLVATALANAEAHDEVRRFGEEQAALGRVATLVAAGAAPEQVFKSVVDEASSLLGLGLVAFGRFDGADTATIIAASADYPVALGSTWSLKNPSVIATVARTKRAARIDDYSGLKGETARAARSLGFRSAIGAPLTVEGRLWGAIVAYSSDPEPIPERSEPRLGQFTELVATAVANAEARAEVQRLADEQAALRRVAVLVAQQPSPSEVFEAVAEEVGRLLVAVNVSIGRYEPEDSITSMASWSSAGPVFPAGVRWPIKGTNVAWIVLQTGRPGRIDDFSAATDAIGVAVREAGYKSAIGSPIVVEGHLWGVISAASTEGPMPPGTEARLNSFTELVATAIANAESSAELAASRRRIVAASDDARRRIERDLHDGIQQRLIALTFRARAMTRRPPDELPGIAKELSEGLKDVSDELREVSRGIHPTILTEAGLGPALRALARRSTVPVDVDVRLDERMPAPIEAAAYYIASEALTNVAKHAHASGVELSAAHDDGVLTLEIHDDGIGGVDTCRGSGILGLTDRVEALGGTISILSPTREGTTLSVHLPSTT